MTLSILFGAVAAGHLAVAGWATLRLCHGGNRLLIVPLALCLALLYDNAVIAAGAGLGPGPLLQTLSVPRFVVHAILTPTLIAWARAAAQRAGVGWAASRTGRSVAWTLTVTAMGIGLSNDAIGLHLQPLTWAGTLRYANIPTPETEALPVVVTGVYVLIAGVGMWQRRQWRPLMIAAAIMAVAAGTGSPLLSNLGELALAVAMALTAHWLRHEPETTAVPMAAMAIVARRAGWIAFPALVVATCLPGLAVNALLQPVYEILLVVHAQLGITLFGMPPRGNRLRRFHTSFGYANIPLLATGQLLALFPATGDLAAALSWVLLLSITIHVGIGIVFALRRRAARAPRPRPDHPSADRQAHTNSRH